MPRLKKVKISFQTPKGMHDILPEDWVYYNRIYKVFSAISEFYGFKKIETPILEDVNLFKKGIGEETDIIQKEMYVLKTKGGDELALRPEGTAPLMRAYFQNNLNKLSQPQKLYYVGPFFRHENPQAGRFREFHQVGFEVLGGKQDPLYDAEAIVLGFKFLKELKIENVSLEINSLGCKTCRPKFIKKLKDYYKKNSGEVCSDCAKRIKTNILRVFDCKNPQCQIVKSQAPDILNSLCSSCRKYLKNTLEYLEELSIPYNLNPYLVRGIDYYSQIVFEFVAASNNEVGSLGGGGRYDQLAKLIGGYEMPAVGGAFGVERLIHILKAQQIKIPLKQGKKVFIVHLGDLAKKKTLLIMEKLYEAGIAFVETQDKESLKAQLKAANKTHSDLALIIGQKEVFDNTIIVRDMHSGAQETVPLSKLVETVKKYIKNI
jgi:histidyl-tRNA synthetase